MRGTHSEDDDARRVGRSNSETSESERVPDPTEVARLREQIEVRDALRQAGAEPQPEVSRHRLLTVLIVAAIVGYAVLRLTLGMRLFDFTSPTRSLVERLAGGAFAIIIALLVGQLIGRFLVARIHDPAHRFNLERVLRLGTAMAVGLVAISVVFVSWYTAIVSLGLISLILGFALQTPITSFIGWIYILARQPYRVGDRIRIGEVHGDVIDVSYLDTTLWEFGGELLSTEHPSGRIIKFPNSTVLNAPVYNYSWPLFPYIWNEIKFQVAYDSDLEFVERTMQTAVEEELGADMSSRVAVYRELLSQTPVDRLEVRDRPSVQFRVAENTWIEAIVRYVVVPREAGRLKTRLIKKMLERLNAAPDRVLFPKSNLR